MADGVLRRWVDITMVRSVLATLREYDRIVSISELDAIVERFGFLKTPSVSGKEVYISRLSAFLNAPWDFGGHEAKFMLRDECIQEVVIYLTSLLLSESPESTLFTQDVFSEYAVVAVDLFGPPDRRIAGKVQELRWRGETVTVTVTNTGRRVHVGMAANQYYDDIDNAIKVDS